MARLRADFAKHRFTQKHSADELIRMQYGAMREARGRVIETRPPAPSAYEIAPAAAANPVAREVVDQAMRAGVDFYQGLQDDDGHWASDYGGPMFLMPGLIIALYVMGKLDEVLPEHKQAEMRRYLRNHQNEDGGFGLHIEGHSTMFGTVLSYVAMRLLGMTAEGDDATDLTVVNTRSWIIARGGAVNVPSWGKFYLCVLGRETALPPQSSLYQRNFKKITRELQKRRGSFLCHITTTTFTTTTNHLTLRLKLTATSTSYFLRIKPSAHNPQTFSSLEPQASKYYEKE